MSLPDPVFVTAADGSPDAQLAALVTQQKLTYNFLLGVAKTVNYFNEGAFNELRAEIEGCKDANLQLRRDLFAVRGTLSSDSTKFVQSELKQALTTMEAELSSQASAKLASLEANLVSLQVSSAASAERMQKMAQYLEELDGARPQEGNELASGFRHVITEISSVRERVRQFEQMSAAAGAADAASPPGIATSQAHAKMLDEIAKKIKTMEETLNLADNSLLAYTSSQAARIDDACAAATVQEGRLAVLEQHATQTMGSIESLRTFQERQY